MDSAAVARRNKKQTDACCMRLTLGGLDEHQLRLFQDHTPQQITDGWARLRCCLTSRADGSGGGLEMVSWSHLEH
jgi:hypothetical protein